VLIEGLHDTMTRYWTCHGTLESPSHGTLESKSLCAAIAEGNQSMIVK